MTLKGFGRGKRHCHRAAHGQHVVVPGIAHVGLEDEARTQLDGAAQGVSEVSREGDAALKAVARRSRCAAYGGVFWPDAQNAPIAGLQPLVNSADSSPSAVSTRSRRSARSAARADRASDRRGR
jgi:hypothetical protein